MQRLIWLIVIAALCIALSTAVVSDDDDDNTLVKKCSADIAEYCSNEKRLWVLLCLESNRNKLSENCLGFMGTTVIGGCDNDAMQFCGEFTEIDDIMRCLEDHKTQLSQSCVSNIGNRQSESENKWTTIEQQSARVTRAITVMSLAYLLIPMSAALWAVLMTRSLHAIQLKVIQEIGVKRNIVNDHEMDTGHCPHWQLCFLRLSYWVTGPPDWTQPWKPNKIRILHEVTGTLSSGSVTAFMGPSGSGKTTLLKLLAGQACAGQFSGVRHVHMDRHGDSGSIRPPSQRETDGGATEARAGAEDGQGHAQALGLSAAVTASEGSTAVQSSSDYDMAMQRQGYVAQQDHFLETLTVWQTLCYAALLRISSAVSNEDKIRRAAKVMQELGLLSVAHSVIGGTNAGAAVTGISGGQRRRLMIAVELLGSPRALLLDEPTSGLDASTSLKLVQELHNISRACNTAIALTIHQPRAETFALFDNLILLGTGGHLIYSGSSSAVAELLSSFPCVQLSRAMYDNPGDFIMDILELDNTQNSQLLRAREVDELMVPSVDTCGDIEMKDTHGDDEEHSLLHASARQTNNNRGNGKDNHHRSTRSDIAKELSIHFKKSVEYAVLLADIKSKIRTSRQKMQQGADKNDSSQHRQPLSPAAPLTQVWILFARRLQASVPTVGELIWFLVQIVGVAVVVTVAFSYDVGTDLELPYQIFMILFMISTYAMILQYLTLIPEYMNERQVVLSENSAGLVGLWPYIGSAMLTEIPRAACQCLILIGIVYSIHPLNPKPINQLFCVVCLLVGVCAWQSLIACCAVITDSGAVAYSLTFLVLGSGTLFGGLLIRLSKIPGVFKFLYYVSVVAVTQRALIVNDMQCCYLSATCNSLRHSYEQASLPPPQPPDHPLRYLLQSTLDVINSHSNNNNNQSSALELASVCPPGLQVTGDGSDTGNLGRMYLKLLGLENDAPFKSLLYLFWANIVFRAVAVLILYSRKYWKYQLVHVKEPTDNVKN